jgi:enamine deaminase RidA (YjgF/YER057c/UK114 family)
MQRQLVSSGTPWEERAAYSRAVRVGAYVHVAGTTASDEHGMVQAHGDAYGQALYIFQKIERALQAAGASLNDVVRTRMFVTDIERWEEVGRAHKAFFDETRPAATLVEVSRLIDPAMLVEIEVDAILSESSNKAS